MPFVRHRRLRQTKLLRGFFSETRLDVEDLVQPLFVKEGLTSPREIASMPGQYQHTLDSLVRECRHLEAAGIPAVILFGIPNKKDLSGKLAASPNGILQKALTAVKKKTRKLIVLADVCLCEYLRHGHCGILKNKEVSNDETLKALAKIAVSYARAGADVIAPSDMMDGRVAVIRRALDKANFKNTPLLSYAVKYASAFYGPFREAAESTPAFGDRKSYQMDARNSDEALREARADLAEGADFLLVKPAGAYLDILQRLKTELSCPVGAYSVSGEYAMIKAAARQGWLDEKKIAIETHLAMKRAGANFILTYWAREMAAWADKKGRIA